MLRRETNSLYVLHSADECARGARMLVARQSCYCRLSARRQAWYVSRSAPEAGGWMGWWIQGSLSHIRKRCRFTAVISSVTPF